MQLQRSDMLSSNNTPVHFFSSAGAACSKLLMYCFYGVLRIVINAHYYQHTAPTELSKYLLRLAAVLLVTYPTL